MHLQLSRGLIFWLCITPLTLGAYWLVYEKVDATEVVSIQILAYVAIAAVVFFIINLYQLSNTTGSARYIAAAMTEEIAEQTALFEELYKNSPVPYLRMKRNGDIISVNNAMLRFFKVEEGRLNNENIFHLITATDENHHNLLPAKISRGQYVNDVEISAQNSDESWRWALLSCFPYGRENERLLTLFDITKQKEVDIAKSEFVSLASHQLRTPISAMKWNVELLGGETLGPLTEAQRGYLDKIERNAEKMHLIISDFLDASQLEMGTFASEVTEIVLRDFLENIYDSFTDRIDQKQLSFTKDYDLTSTLAINTDERLLHNVISNLISNAVKYTPEQGQVTVRYTTTASEITFTISDSGMGIPKGEQEHLFTKFFRAQNAKAEVTEGTGLGLYIVAQAVEKLGGTIGVESEENEGTTFTVTIPRTLNT